MDDIYMINGRAIMKNNWKKSLSIIVPVFNEEEAVVKTVSELRATFFESKIIVIDDGSTDASSKQLSSLKGIKLIRHEKNRGYGASWKSGVSAARTEYVAFYDADGQFIPGDLEEMAEIAITKSIDLISGNRKIFQNVPLARIPGKLVLHKFAEFLINQKIEDLNCGLRVFRKEALEAQIDLLPNGFSASTTSLLVFLKNGNSVEFKKISFLKRKGKSSVSIIKDGINTLRLITSLTLLLDPTRVFSIISIFILIPASAYSLLVLILQRQGLPVLGAVLLIASLQIYLMGLIAGQIADLRLTNRAQIFNSSKKKE